MRWLLSAAMVLIGGFLAESVWAECKVFTTPPTYTAGQLKDVTCDTRGILSVGGMPGSATAAAPTYTEGSAGSFSFDLAGNARVTLGTFLAGEDTAATGGYSGGVIVVESRYLTLAPTLVDVQVKASAGYVKNLVCSGSDAAATAGTIILYDSLSETGTIVYQWDVQAVALTSPNVFPIERAFATGIYLGFTTTGDVRCIVSYR